MSRLLFFIVLKLEKIKNLHKGVELKMTIDEKMFEYLNEKSPYIFAKRVNPRNLIIEERVKVQCFHCEKYNKKWTCPPKVDKFDFKKMFEEYDNAMVVYCEIPFSGKEEYDKVRNSSTNLVHRVLLDLEKLLYCNNESLAVSFIGGSCKLCKTDCGEKACRFPHMARMPLEATGVNVIKFIKKELEMDIVFPLDKYMYRFGLILW